MRRRQLPVGALALGVFPMLGAFATDARADDCLDASDRARAELQARHLLAARAELRVCAASTCADEVRSVCEERLVEVIQRLPTIVFDVKGEDGADVTELAITVDDRLATEPLGTEMPLDPGPHAFSFRSGSRAIARTFVLLEREKGRRETVAFAREPERRPALTQVRLPSPPPLPVEPPPPTPWRTVGAFTAAAGAVGLGIGAAFGIVAMGKNADADCDAANVCADPRSRHDARIAADVSTVSFVTGAVLAAAGVLLFVFAPKLR